MNNTQNKQNPLLIIPKNATQFFINGPQGKLDCLELKPLTHTHVNHHHNLHAEYKGIAIIFHPHPVGGGSYTNKVVQSIAKVLNNRGYLCICPNLRGVGLSDGTYDNGIGEIDDARAIYQYIMNHDTYKKYAQKSLILAGFSFGSSIASILGSEVAHQKLILVGVAVTRFKVIVPDTTKTIVIHGENDEIISITDVFAWSKIHNQPIIWVPDAKHFFHGQLLMLQNIIGNFIS